MRATEICGEVFFAKYGLFFKPCGICFAKSTKGMNRQQQHIFFVVAVVRYIIIGINGICVLCISIVLQLFKCRKTKKNINGNPVS